MNGKIIKNKKNNRSGLSKSGRNSDHWHRSIVERIHFIRTEYQSNHIGKDELGTIKGLYECSTCG